MEYQKVINLLGNTANQSSKLRTKNWVEINDDACGIYNNNSKFYVIIVMHIYLQMKWWGRSR